MTDITGTNVGDRVIVAGDALRATWTIVSSRVWSPVTGQRKLELRSDGTGSGGRSLTWHVLEVHLLTSYLLGTPYIRVVRS